jgi:hypothetical protein
MAYALRIDVAGLQRSPLAAFARTLPQGCGVAEGALRARQQFASAISAAFFFEDGR